MRRVSIGFFLVLIFSITVAARAETILVTPTIRGQIPGTETRITTDLADQYDPAISGNIIVYTDTRGADRDIWYYDLTTGKEQPVTTAPGNQDLTDVSDGLIVYTDESNADIMLFDPSTGFTTDLTAQSNSVCIDPSIGQKLVAWTDNRDGNLEIYAKDLTTGEERRITNSPAIDERSAVDNGTIVWERCSASLCEMQCSAYTCDIWAYDWATATTRQITNTPTGDERYPDVWKNRVVYEGLRDGERDIFFFDMTTGQEKQLVLPGEQRNPNISGDFVSFEDLSTGAYKIRLWHVPSDTVYDVSPGTSGSQFLNDIDGNRVVWTDDRNGQLDIYLYEFQNPEVTFGRDIFHEDFNTDSVGQLPSTSPAGLPDGDWLSFWNASTSNSSILVQGPACDFTSNSLRFTKIAGIGNSPIFEGHPDPAYGPYTSGLYKVTWRSLSEASQYNSGFAALVNPYNYSAFTVNYGFNGTLLFQDGTGAIDTGIQFTPNVSQQFEATVDLDNRTFDLSINGTTVGTKRPFQYPQFTSIDRFHWEIGGVDTESYAIDDIRISCIAYSDMEPPTTTVSFSPGPNLAGWNNSAVAAALSASDGCAGSGVKELHYQLGGGPETTIAADKTSISVATEGINTLTYYSIDNQGNMEPARTANIKIDLTPPAISLGTCPSTVNLNSSISLNIGVSDNLSGITSQSVTNGPYVLDTSSVGSKTLTVSAEDNAANQASSTCSYKVIYDFAAAGGFQAPINNPPVLNTAKAGSAIPVKWQLPNGQGGFISDLGAVTSIQFQQVSCSDISSTLTDPVEAVATGNSGLHYDYTTNQYIFNWQTLKSWAGSCYTMILSLNDGSQYYANFSLK